MLPISRRHLLRLAAGTALATTVPAAITVRFAGQAAADEPDSLAPQPVPLGALFNNNGIDTATLGGGNFDGAGRAYPGESLPSGSITLYGVPYLFGSAGELNNVVALGQTIPLPPGRYHSALFLTAGSTATPGGIGDVIAPATVHYADGSQSQSDLTAINWASGAGEIVTPTSYLPGGKPSSQKAGICATELWLDPERDAVSISLPTTATPGPGVASLHVFALTMQPAVAGRAAAVRDARGTTSLVDGHQSVEAIVVNAGTAWLTERDELTVTVDVAGARCVAPARIDRLAPGEQARVRIGIASSAAPGTGSSGSVVLRADRDVLGSRSAALTLGVPDYQPTIPSLTTHQAPYWFDDAKFGIFIHWGVYSVPAWATVGRDPAEWYWQRMGIPGNPTYAYHRQTYGENFNYDDFIPRFTAEKYDPAGWIRLIEQAGAEYFVFTSKHHEGFALWNTQVSGRNSVQLGPHRDLVKALLDAAAAQAPWLKRGLYYSLPEWFNPDLPWQGHGPRNPYTLQPVPYTGYQTGRDYVHDYQTKQVLELVENFDPDVIWYDMNKANDTPDVLAEYFNRAKNRPRPKDVTVDNRGGVPIWDYTTPEYTTYANTVIAKWEATRGLDPFSFGYNQLTADAQYMTTEQVVSSLVDIVSKNGNFLLDIGPKSDGTIPDIMVRRLVETGEWLRTNGEAIYGTTYWSRMAQLGELRFTVKPNRAFYIHSLAPPSDRLVVGAPVPIRPGDRVTLLGYHDHDLDWSHDNSGAIVIDVPKPAQRTGQYVWVFKIDHSRQATPVPLWRPQVAAGRATAPCARRPGPSPTAR